MLIDNNIIIFITLSIGLIALFFFILDKFPMEVVSIGLLVGLATLKLVFPDSSAPDIEELLAGFANPGLITVMALLIMAEGMIATGAISSLVNIFDSENKIKPIFIFSFILLCVAILSSVLNNTPIVIMFIPLIAALAERKGLDISKSLIPLSYVSMLGGMVTLIGSSTNLIGAGMVTNYGLKPLGMLDISIPALIIAIPSILFVIYVIPFLLPTQKSVKSLFSRDARQFLAEIEVEHDSKLIGIKVINNTFTELSNSNILFVQRGEHAFYPPINNVTLKVGDIIVIAATRKSLENAMAQLGDQFNPHLTKEPGESLDNISDEFAKQAKVLAEVLVAPRSEMIGKDLEQIRFRSFTGCLVLGLLRRSRMLRDRITEIPLQAGDVLLVQGNDEAISNLKTNTDVVLIDWSKKYIPQKNKLFRAMLIFLTTILSAAFGIIDIATASILGASAMIMSTAISVNRAANAVDRRIYITIACMLAYGSALESTGAAYLIVSKLLGLTQGLPTSFILSFLFILITIVTNLLTNNATVIIFMPIAINLAYALNVEPTPFIISVILAANLSFLTPFGYQTNLLVMAPGQYKFIDYIRCGIPLTFFIWVIFILFIPKYFGFN